MATYVLVKMSLLALAFLPFALTQCTTSAAPGVQVGVANGYKWAVVATGLRHPRSIVFDPKGRLIVVEVGSPAGYITAIELTSDAGTCVKEKSRKVIQTLNGLNHGLAFSRDKGYIYASTSDVAYSWAYDASTPSLSKGKVVVKNMNNPDHNTRTLFKSTFDHNMLLVSRGSNDNIDPDAAYLSSGRSQIRAFDLSKIPQGGYDYTTQGLRLGWGLRNSVGVTEHPVTGGIYSVENSCDELRRDGVDVHQDDPGEEMNFHGTLLNNKFAGQGGSHGYPNCFSAWDTSILPNNANLKTGSPFANKSSLDYLCTGTNPARLTFQAHMAPLDVKFDKTGKEGWVTFHGSWDRTSPAGYKVAKIPFANGEPVPASDSKTSTTDVLYNLDNSQCPGNCFRPVSMAFDSQGRLFISDDNKGEIFVLVKE